MTFNAVQFLSEILNDFFKQKLGLNESLVLVNRIVNADGSMPQVNINKVVVTLHNIEEDVSFQRINQKVNFANEVVRHLYSVYVLVISNFEDYKESLKNLDTVIDFFNNNPVLSVSTNTNFPVELTRISVETFNINLDQISNLWSSIGAKQQPFILYKVRLM